MFSDLPCECGDQLRLAMSEITTAQQGILIAIPGQDGRGKGLAFKLGTLYLQREAGFDTYEAAVALAGSKSIDQRTYGGAIGILRYFKISPSQRVRLMTNNPSKLSALAENGYGDVERASILIEGNEHTARHLEAKFTKLGHLQ
jgi:GTP cyclohydrolase II